MTLYAPIVGMHFRPPAAAVVRSLPAGFPLVLMAEPTNPHDHQAIRVLVDLREYPRDLHETLDENLRSCSWSASAEELCACDRPFMLGYVAKPRPEKGLPVGNIHVFELAEAYGLDLRRGLNADLTFDASGQPLAQIRDFGMIPENVEWWGQPLDQAG